MAININHQTDTICATGGTLNLPDYSGGGGSGGCLKLLADRNYVTDGSCSGCAVSGATDNIFLGSCAGKCNTSGDYNIYLGQYAGERATTVSNNVVIGRYVGCKLASGGNVILGSSSFSAGAHTGEYNVILGGSNFNQGAVSTNGCQISIGYYANYYSGGTACKSIAIGTRALFCNWGDRNIALGDSAMSSKVATATTAVTGSNNVAIGAQYALYALESGLENIAIGQRTSMCVTSGCYNISLGCMAGSGDAGANSGTGNYNVSIGIKAGSQLSSGANNIALGQLALGNAVLTGSNNVAIGCDAGQSTISGEDNVFIGRNAGYGNTTASGNVYIGKNAGQQTCGGEYSDGGCNIAIGVEAGCGLNREDKSAAEHNINIGYRAGRSYNNSATAGDKNIFIGCYAGNVTSGHTNIGIGNWSGGKSGGECNTFVGQCAGNNTYGNINVAIGFCAGKTMSSACKNTFLGFCAGSTVTGQNNTFIGHESGKSGGGQSSGNCNTALGGQSMCNVTSGNLNVAIGFDAGRDISTSSCNVFIGMCAGNNVNSGGSNVAIGPDVELASPTGDHQFIIGVGSSTWVCGDSSFNIKPGAGILDSGDNVGTAGSVLASTGSGVCWVAAGGGGGGLTNWTESANTASPNDVIAANRLIVTGAGTTIDAVIQPKGSGAFLAQLPDGAAAGGDKRGCYSVDLQLERGNAACVASGCHGAIGGGYNNKVTGEKGTVAGGFNNSAAWWGSVTGGCGNSANSNWAHVGGGHANTAGYAGVVAGGQSNTAGTYGSVLGGSSNSANGYGAVSVAAQGSSANGDRSTVMGNHACTRDRDGSIAIAAQCGVFSGNCKIQYSLMNMGVDTTDATQVALRSKSSAAGTDNQLTIPTNSAYSFTGTVIANVTSGGDTHAWEFKGVMKRGSGNASLVGTPSIDDIAYDSGASAWSIALAADTTNQALAVCVTGQASTNIRWVSTLQTTELTH